MRIVIATGIYPPDIGGPATHTRLLEELLPARGIEVEAIPFRIVRGVPVGMRQCAYVWQLYKRSRKADAILAQDTARVGLAAILAGYLAHVPVLVRVSGDYAWEQGRQRFGVRDTLDAFQTSSYSWRVEALRALSKFVVHHAERIIVSSRYFEHIVSGWGIDARRLFLIPNGIELPTTTTGPKRASRHILTVSRLIEGKGFETLIDVFADLPSEWKLTIVGDGPLRDALQKRAQIRNVTERTHFTSSVPASAMPEYYQHATVFVLNSESESFSFSVLEAMAWGVPVIATNVGAIPELIESGREGILVAPNDASRLKEAILSLVTEESVWRERAAAARKKAQAFSAETMAERFATQIKTLGSSPP